MDFMVVSDKIKLTAPAQIGYYTFNVSGARSMFVSNSGGTPTNEPNLMIFNATDRNANSYYTSAFQYNNSPTSSIYKGVLNYNAGDKIQFKIKIDGLTDYTKTLGIIRLIQPFHIEVITQIIISIIYLVGLQIWIV
jgi:hypothetical protein